MRDSDILKKLHSDPNIGMSLLMNCYAGLVYSVVKGKLSDPHFSSADIEECVADVFSEFYRDLNRYDPSLGSIKAWLCTMAKHNALDLVKKRANEFCHISTDDDESFLQFADDFSVEEHYIDKEFRHALMQAIVSLGEPDHEIIVRKFYLEESTKSIAKRLNMTVSAIDTRAHRALKKLREKLGVDQV